MSCVAIIPARGGSRRIPKKNIRDFHGKPILAYSIETAKAAGLFDQIVVSTDDDEIRDVAWSYGAKYLEREPEFARDEVGTKAVMARAIKQLELDAADTVVCIYPCAPLIEPGDLQWGINLLVLRPAYFVVSIGTEPLADAGAFYCSLANHWDHPAVPIYGIRTAYYPLPPQRVCDINTPEDWARAEELYAARMAERL